MRTALFLFAAIAAASAQVPSDPPPFIQITRVPNGSKSGRNYQAAHPAVDVIGLSAMTGVPETWYLEPHLNFASIEAVDHALQGVATAGPANQFGEAAESTDEFLGSPRTMIGAYVPGSGYRPGETMRALPKARYFRMSIYRVHPGEDNFISNLGTARRSIYDRVNLDRPDVIYKIISGAATGTYLVIAPLPSLASIDDGMQRLPEYAEPFSGAEVPQCLGGPRAPAFPRRSQAQLCLRRFRRRGRDLLETAEIAGVVRIVTGVRSEGWGKGVRRSVRHGLSARRK